MGQFATLLISLVSSKRNNSQFLKKTFSPPRSAISSEEQRAPAVWQVRAVQIIQCKSCVVSNYSYDVERGLKRSVDKPKKLKASASHLVVCKRSSRKQYVLSKQTSAIVTTNNERTLPPKRRNSTDVSKRWTTSPVRQMG